MKIVTWSEDRAKSELSRRLKHSQGGRAKFEKSWTYNEQTIYSVPGGASSSLPELSELTSGDSEEIEAGGPDVQVSYAFKNFRFIHAQLSANPPSVVTRPTSNDPGDRRKADAADRLVRHGLRTYQMQEFVDLASRDCLLYGTGFIKMIWDSTKGEIAEFDEETGEITLTGDIHISVPSPRRIFLDPDAEIWTDVRYVFERILMPFEEALCRWPEKEELLKAAMVAGSGPRTGSGRSQFEDMKYDAVELYEYWEKGLPVNAFLGRHCFCTRDGELVSKVTRSPFRFTAPGAISEIEADEKLSDEKKEELIKKIPEIAGLPYHILTDIDAPSQVLGRSFLEHAGPLQDLLNRLDGTTLDNIKAHGVTRLVLPEGAEIAKGSITNSAYDVVKVTGNSGGWLMEAPKSMPLVDNFRASMKTGVDDMSGMNESMFGQQSREQSGQSMQYAVNQGNMIRRRLFNKYVLFVEGIWRSYLNLVRRHWTEERTIYVLGKEKALLAVDIQGADIDGGFDLVVEYGASLSLDPMTRREEILTLMPTFKEAGVPARVALKMMKLNELEGMYDMMQLAEDRQREIFEEIIARGEQIEPGKFQDHENMIAYAFQYVMTTEFKYLEQDRKDLILAHIEARLQQAGTEKAPQQVAAGPMTAPGPVPGAPAGPLPPVPGGEQAPAPPMAS